MQSYLYNYTRPYKHTVDFAAAQSERAQDFRQHVEPSIYVYMYVYVYVCIYVI